MSAHKLTVNLLPPSEFEQSFWGKFLKWAVTTGRYIIILVEMVVIIAFLSRFKLDEELRVVNEQIESQVNYLESQQAQLREFYILQKRISLAEKSLNSRVGVTEMINYVDRKRPLEISIYQQAMTKNEITLSAVTLSEAALGNMLLSMSRDGMWKSLDLTQIVSDAESGIKFTLSAKK